MSEWKPDADLAAKLAEARKRGRWLFCSYQEIWLSPDELEAGWGKGQFRWSGVNFTVRSPFEKVAEITATIGQLEKERVELFTRIAARSGAVA